MRLPALLAITGVLLATPALPAVTVDAHAIGNDHVRLQAVGDGDTCRGVLVLVDGRPLATIDLGPAGAITSPWPQGSRTPDGAELVLRPVLAAAAGMLGPQSHVTVSLGDDAPWPEIAFRLDLQRFDAAGWQAVAGGTVPFHYLLCRLPGATMHYHGGALIPAPIVDPFPITAKTYMAGEWEDGWTYAPALAGWAVPAIGLWNPEASTLVAYDFNRARHTDRSDAHIAGACKMGAQRAEHFCLVHPYQNQWVQLTYPQPPCTVASCCELLYSRELPDSADPNRFVLRRLWAERRELLPPVPRMNDLAWIPRYDAYAPSGKIEPTAAGVGLLHPSGRAGLEGAFVEEGATMLGNDFISDGVMRAVLARGAEGPAQLREDLEFLMDNCTFVERDGDRCATWVHPIAGRFMERWGGERCATIHHTSGFQIGAGMLLAYEQTKDKRLLPFIDGVYNWCKHYLYTRNGVCDLPWAMFCRAGTAAGENFLLNYRRVFSDDPQRAANCDEALQLALTSLYKVLWFFTADPELHDDLDPTFLNQAVNDARWCGRVTWNECGWVLRTMVPLYCETGDDFLKYLLRGALERYYAGFREDGGMAENLQVFGEIEPAGLRTAGFPDACHGGIVRRWARPSGDATLRVAMGESAAIAFCLGTAAYDVSQYAFSPAPGYRFRLSALHGGPDRINLIATAPFRDLRGLGVRIDGEPVAPERLEVNEATRGEDLYIRAVPVGAVVEIGDTAGARTAVAEDIPYRAGPAPTADGWRTETLPNTVALGTRWWEPEDWYGLTPGQRTVWGIPLEPAAMDGGIGALERGRVFLNRPARAILALFGAPREQVPPAGALRVQLADGTTRQVTLSEGVPLDLCNGFPLRRFETYLATIDLEHEAQVAWVEVAEGTLLALTTASEQAVGLKEALARVERERVAMLGVRTALQVQTPHRRCEERRPWATTALRRRFRLTVPPTGREMHDAIVTVKEDFALLMRQVGAGPFVPRGFEAFEVLAGEEPRPVPVQFDHLPPRGLTRGELLVKMPGATGPRQSRSFDIYFGPREPEATSGVRCQITPDAVTVETGPGGLRFVFALGGEGPGPRWTELRFDLGGEGRFDERPNVLGPSGFSGGGADLTCVTDRVTWYDFGALQTRPAAAHVLHQGPLSATIMVSGLEMWGHGSAGQMPTNLGTTSGTGLKGEARWYFRFFAGSPRIDSWVDFRLSDADTGWTRPLQVRYGLGRWEQAATRTLAGGTYALTEDIAVLPQVSEATRIPPRCLFTLDGNVLQVSFSQPDAEGEYFTGRWTTMPGGLDEGRYETALTGIPVEQFSVEELRSTGPVAAEPGPLAPVLLDSTGGRGPAPRPGYRPVAVATDAMNRDPSLEAEESVWLAGGGGFAGGFSHSHPYSGEVAADLSCAEGDIAMLQTNGRGSALMGLQPESPYEVAFVAKCSAGAGKLHVNFYAPGYDFPHARATLPADGRWHQVKLKVTTGRFVPSRPDSVFPLPDETAPALRIWTYQDAQTVYVDEVTVRPWPENGD